MTAKKVIESKVDSFQAIYLESLRIDTILDFDLYINKSDSYILYRGSNLPFTEKNRKGLIENNIDKLHISSENQKEYQRYIEKNIEQIIHDPTIPENTKAGIIYNSAKLMVQDIFNNPTLEENIKRSQDMVENTVSFIIKGKNTFHSLIQMMSFDYSTYTHSINVCALSIGLARFSGTENQLELDKIGTGALLHDVGKTKVSETIINKPGPLTSIEMDFIKKHPKWGYDIVKETDMISSDSYIPILQHHERENGSGYPDGLTANEIHPYGKIVAIADVFDAMTTKRTYKHAMNSFPALKEMYTDKDAFDHKLLDQFAKLMGPTDLGKL
ncbi:MAG: HD-GYP domain-containing protein [candidate division Zixibacteria bacterium]|nr:HD-GYP domain-containing protein [candidate division Zixibacteria bacterium]